MEKYILKSITGYVGTDRERELKGFTNEDFERYEKGDFSHEENEDYQNQAIEDQGFEWWIEKANNDEE